MAFTIKGLGDRLRRGPEWAYITQHAVYQAGHAGWLLQGSHNASVYSVYSVCMVDAAVGALMLLLLLLLSTLL